MNKAFDTLRTGNNWYFLESAYSNQDTSIFGKVPIRLIYYCNYYRTFCDFPKIGFSLWSNLWNKEEWIDRGIRKGDIRSSCDMPVLFPGILGIYFEWVNYWQIWQIKFIRRIIRCMMETELQKILPGVKQKLMETKLAGTTKEILNTFWNLG